jgi:hypothetical protein
MPASHFDVNKMTGRPKFIVRHSTNRWRDVADIMKQSVGHFQQIQLLKSKASSVCL